MGSSENSGLTSSATAWCQRIIARSATLTWSYSSTEYQSFGSSMIHIYYSTSSTSTRGPLRWPKNRQKDIGRNYYDWFSSLVTLLFELAAENHAGYSSSNTIKITFPVEWNFILKLFCSQIKDGCYQKFMLLISNHFDVKTHPPSGNQKWFHEM